jgi:predicted AlkP superfamily pyrophosphatase or phosphodiesterase
MVEEFTTAELPAEPATPLTSGDIEHVVIISMDGVRPDAIDEADTPNLDRLIAQGAYSRHAQTIDPSFTLPSHTSMLSGVAPKKHGIVEALPCIGCRLTIGPTIFSVAQEAGLSTGMVFGKEKLNYIALPGTVDELFGVDAYDPEVLDEALTVIQESMTNILFIHFPDTDRVGHAYGWMSPNYLYAVSHMDGSIGKIVDTLDSEGYLDTTLLIIQSDHGGHDFQHGLACSEDMTIPWLAVGPGVPQGVTLTSQIRTYDTAATAAYAFNLPIPERWDGRPVLEIFEDQLATVTIQ